MFDGRYTCTCQPGWIGDNCEDRAKCCQDDQILIVPDDCSAGCTECLFDSVPSEDQTECEVQECKDLEDTNVCVCDASDLTAADSGFVNIVCDGTKWPPSIKGAELLALPQSISQLSFTGVKPSRLAFVLNESVANSNVVNIIVNQDAFGLQRLQNSSAASAVPSNRTAKEIAISASRSISAVPECSGAVPSNIATLDLKVGIEKICAVKDKVESAFDSIDLNNDGTVSKEELAAELQKPGGELATMLEDAGINTAAFVLEQMDGDKNGNINVNEFKHARKDEQRKAEANGVGFDAVGMSAFVAGLSFYAAPYRKGFYLWETADLFRKLLLVSIIVFIADGTSLQLAVGVVFAVGGLVLQLMYKPFLHPSENALAAVSQGILALSLVVGGLLRASKAETAAMMESGDVDSFVAGVYMITSGALLYVIALAIWFGNPLACLCHSKGSSGETGNSQDPAVESNPHFVAVSETRFDANERKDSKILVFERAPRNSDGSYVSDSDDGIDL
eukprot:gene20153-31922_t